MIPPATNLSESIKADLNSATALRGIQKMQHVIVYHRICFIFWSCQPKNQFTELETVKAYVETHWTRHGIDEFRYLPNRDIQTVDFVIEVMRFALHHFPVTFDITRNYDRAIIMTWARGPQMEEVEAILRAEHLHATVFMNRIESRTAIL